MNFRKEKQNIDSKAIKMAIKQPVIRCVIFVVVVGFSLLVCLPVCLFVYFFG